MSRILLTPTEYACVEQLEKVGAILHGHFLLASGRHSDTYVQKFNLIENPQAFDVLCARLASLIKPSAPEYIAGPVTAGILVAYAVARRLEVKCLVAERDSNGQFAFLRQGVPMGAKVAVVDDVVTTGESLVKVTDAVRFIAGETVCTGALIARAECPDHVLRACTVPVKSYAPDELPAHLQNSTPVRMGFS
ncbi:MAG: orotate phosphoribosyltransferase [Armatimonadetes bacterium]|nr:orotate phosphoribosyltransferase [Armatimonadota bacterium]